MQIFKNGSRPSVNMNDTGWFSGNNVRYDPIFNLADDPKQLARAGAGLVTFEPQARTKWHTHPIGQLLIVIAGSGFVQLWGKARQAIQTGDVVWIEAGEKHWHGAGEHTAMSHIAINEYIDGNTVEWLEPVSDEDYQN